MPTSASQLPREHRPVPMMVRAVVWACGLVAVFLSVTWTQKEYPAATSGWLLAGIGLLGLAGLGLRALSTAPLAHRLAELALSAGGALALSLTTRDTFSVWLAGSALLVMACLNLDLTMSWPGVLVSAIGASAGVTWAGTHDLHEVGPSLFAVAVAAVALVIGAVLLVAARRVAVLRAQARAAVALEASNQDLQRRAELARELHDALGHSITAMVIQSEAGQVTAPDAALGRIGELGRVALVELEEVLFDLRGQATRGRPMELENIESHLLPELRARGLDVRTNLTTTAAGRDELFTIYRVVQESLTNVMKHSNAQRVSVDVVDEGADVVVRVVDDGRGLGPGATSGSGVAGMRARVEGLGGTFHWPGTRPRGVLVRATFPRSGA